MSFGRDTPFDFFASTGRTATTHIASVLNDLDDISACHEGYLGHDKDAAPVLPLINLENAQAYNSASAARACVQEKRNPSVVSQAIKLSGSKRLIDVAYYNPAIGHELLTQLPECRMVGIIRDCEGFVRSCTTMAGEDPLPVGWPDPQKRLTEREKFIAMGRARPKRGSPEKAQWNAWSAIRRNIWLWTETNLRLCEARRAFPDRSTLVRFETFQTRPEDFWHHVESFLDLPGVLRAASRVNEKAVNKKPFGYQVASAQDWSDDERQALKTAEYIIGESAIYDC